LAKLHRTRISNLREASELPSTGPSTGAGIKIFGHKSVAIHDNYASNFSVAVLNGATDSALTESTPIWVDNSDWGYDAINWGDDYGAGDHEGCGDFAKGRKFTSHSN
jgi:hypothetical protein